MKKPISFLLCTFLYLPFIFSQSTNDILNLLVDNKILNAEQADSVRAEAAIKQQEADARKKSFRVTSAKALQISGYGHFRYQYLKEEDKIDGVDIRRAYLDIKGALNPYWSYRLQTDFAGSPKIVDIYTELTVNDRFNFTIGQQVIPFSLNNVTSNTKLELADRSQVVEALSSRKGDVLGDNNGRDIGIALYGSLISFNNLKLVEYRLGIFNGSGINKADLNEAKDVIGRIILHPVTGLDLGGSYYSGWTPDSATLNNKIVPKQLGLRQRIGAEVNFTYEFINIKGEFISGTDGEVNKSGFYGQVAAYVVPNKLQIAGRYDTYDKDVDKADNALTSYVLGANYFINSNALLQLAYTIKQEEGTSIDNNTGSIQLQISF